MTIFSLLFNLIYFNWRIITLQFCDGFCQTETWISHRSTRVHPAPHPPPASPPQPSGLSQSTSGCSASCTELALVTCFTHSKVPVWMPFSQVIPLASSHWARKSILYICVSRTARHAGSTWPIFLNSIDMCHHTVPVSLFLADFTL